MISAAQDSEITAAARASCKCGRAANRRICQTAALAPFLLIFAFAASHAEEVAYPSSSCPSAASNRRKNAACAAVSLDCKSLSEVSTSPTAAVCRSSAAGELRKSSPAPAICSASAALPGTWSAVAHILDHLLA